MNVVIIEDEPLSAGRIRDLLRQIDPGINVSAMPDSVKSSVRWFRENPSADLVFMDIQLGDGLSFDIFGQVDPGCPVIFTTAYQEYAIRAFKVNSVDYLLKPVSEADLRAALRKYRQVYARNEQMPAMDTDLLLDIRQMLSSPYKSRFMVKVGDRIKSVDVKDILYFFSLQKGTYLHTADNRNYVVDFTLDALSELLDPGRFHRINRRYIISHSAISDMITLSANKLRVALRDSDDDGVYISRERLASFKEWLDR